jgi:hypothetical protein
MCEYLHGRPIIFIPENNMCNDYDLTKVAQEIPGVQAVKTKNKEEYGLHTDSTRKYRALSRVREFLLDDAIKIHKDWQCANPFNVKGYREDLLDELFLQLRQLKQIEMIDKQGNKKVIVSGKINEVGIKVDEQYDDLVIACILNVISQQLLKTGILVPV